MITIEAIPDRLALLDGISLEKPVMAWKCPESILAGAAS